jgi:hypothetical protein
MPSNFIIGIGGTGCRCVEALLHLSAAGLGPPDLWVGFIDQDSSNGNLADASAVLQQLGFLRKHLKEGATDHAGGADWRFLRTELWAAGAKASELRSDHAFLWRPAPNDDDTFGSVFGYDGPDLEAQALMQALYYRGPEKGLRADQSEHHMPLKTGFRGRPGLGAAVLLNKASNQHDPFWRNFTNCIKPALRTVNQESGRVLLIGSVFGGTGAGGLPIIARFLRRMAEDPANQWNMRLAAVLVGPYFKFTPPDAQKGLSADPTNFRAKLRDAFQYYANLLEDEATFDRVYLSGWPHEVDYRGDPATDRSGGPDQRNPATLPELYAALAANEYFTAAPDSFPSIDRMSRTTAVYATSWHGEERTEDNSTNARQTYITWSDLPPGVGRSAADLREALGQLIRFCHVYRAFFRRVLVQDNLRGPIRQEHWYRRLALHGMEDDLKRDPKEILNNLGDYCDRLLTWWGGIDLIRSNADLPRALVDASVFATLGNGNYTSVSLKSNVEDQASWNNFETMVKGAESRGLALDAVFRTLTNAKPNDQTRGLGRFVRALYDACAI